MQVWSKLIAAALARPCFLAVSSREDLHTALCYAVLCKHEVALNTLAFLAYGHV